MAKIKVAAYCRVSTGSDQQLNSLENQQLHFGEYADSDKFELIDVYTDRGETATRADHNRKGLIDMLYDSGLDYEQYKGESIFLLSDRKAKFEEIHVTNSARFSRDVLSLDLFRKLHKKGVYVVTDDGRVNTRERPDSFHIILELSLNQNDSINKSEIVRSGHLKSAKKGNIFTNDNLYGYRLIYDNETKKNTLIPIPEEREVVEEIFNLYIGGMGEQRIANHLEQKGVFTRKGKPFQRATIRKMLTNEKYYGASVRNKIDQGKVFNRYKTHKIKPKEEWVIREDLFEPIVDKEKFELAQQIRASKVSHVTQRGLNHGKTEFAQKIKCGQCGKNYVMCVDKNKYYACSTKRTKRVSACDAINIRLKFLEDYIEWLMKGGLRVKLNVSKLVTQNQINIRKDELLNRLDQSKLDFVKEKEAELTSLKEEQRRIIKEYAKRRLDEDLYNEMIEETLNNIDQLEVTILEYSKSNDEILEEIKQLDVRLHIVENADIKDAFTREEVINAIKTIVVTKEVEEPSKPKLTVEWDYEILSVVHLDSKKKFMLLLWSKSS
jgi:site-specific DNA recombinase